MPSTIILKPASKIVNFKQSVLVTCKAVGYPNVHLEMKGPDGTVIQNSSTLPVATVTFTVVPSEEHVGGGDYTCIASNNLSTVNETAVVSGKSYCHSLLFRCW